MFLQSLFNYGQITGEEEAKNYITFSITEFQPVPTKSLSPGRPADGRAFEPFFQPVTLLDSPIPTIQSDAFSLV
jgi:hypothetical protein